MSIQCFYDTLAHTHTSLHLNIKLNNFIKRLCNQNSISHCSENRMEKLQIVFSDLTNGSPIQVMNANKKKAKVYFFCLSDISIFIVMFVVIFHYRAE